MALPQLNDTPKYDIVIPSLQKTVKFRPFLVKEQKVLLMALESQDEKQIINAIVDTVKSCAQEPLQTDRLTPFDVEYLFVKIRSKSVGEKSKVNIKCESCEADNDVEINLDDIDISDKNKTKKIVLNKNYTLEMKYPTYKEVSSVVTKGQSVTSQLYSSIILSMDKLHTNDELIDMKEETWEEKENFIDSLTSEQFEKIIEFISNAPNLRYTAVFKCTSCGTENSRDLMGIRDFF
jgi:hypothetical protein